MMTRILHDRGGLVEEPSRAPANHRRTSGNEVPSPHPSHPASSQAPLRSSPSSRRPGGARGLRSQGGQVPRHLRGRAHGLVEHPPLGSQHGAAPRTDRLEQRNGRHHALVAGRAAATALSARTIRATSAAGTPARWR